MRILISADYLLASAFCAQSDIHHYYSGLTRLKNEHEAGHPVFLEPNALLKLQSKGHYPSLDLFKKNFPTKHDLTFGAEQITKVVIYLLSNVAQLKVDDDILAEWHDLELEVDSDLHSDEERDNHLAELMVDLSLENAGFGYDHIVFHHHLPCFPRAALVTGTITSVVPNQFPVPKSIEHTIPISDDLLDYIKSINAEKCYQLAGDDNDVKRALYFGVVQFFLQNGRDPKSFDENCFVLGEGFRSSTLDNECAGNSAFSCTLFETVVRVLAGQPKKPISTFDTSDKSGIQLVKNGRSAWRTHVTGGARALRLMFWKHDNGVIELANVGNKWECEIA